MKYTYGLDFEYIWTNDEINLNYEHWKLIIFNQKKNDL